MKQELKPGDRVRVEFEGVVEHVSASGDAVRVGHHFTPEGDYLLDYFRADDCTLVGPKIVLPEVPGTIVQVDPLNEHHQRAVYEFDRFPEGDWWRFGYRDALNTHELIEECRQYDYRVIPAAEAVDYGVIPEEAS